jgi:hypothetical protein
MFVVMFWPLLQEVEAARTIAERGVVLVGTAHGNNLSNLMRNPVLRPLVGGVNAVTLGDQMAARTNSKCKVRALCSAQLRSQPGACTVHGIADPWIQLHIATYPLFCIHYWTACFGLRKIHCESPHVRQTPHCLCTLVCALVSAPQPRECAWCCCRPAWSVVVLPPL